MTRTTSGIYVVEGINPEPWTAGKLGFNPKTRKPFKYPDKKMKAYQKALAAEIKELYRDPPMLDPKFEFEMVFWFWRSTEQGQPADATNMQKATEDALQGVLFPNDRACQQIRSVIVEQAPDTESRILIEIRPFTQPTPPSALLVPRRKQEPSPDHERRADYEPEF